MIRMSEFTVNQEEAFYPIGPDWEAAVAATFRVKEFARSISEATEGLEDAPALTVLVDGRAMLSTVGDELDGGKKVLLDSIKAIMERNPAWKIGFVTEHGAKVQWTEGSKPSVKYDADAIDNLLLALYAYEAQPIGQRVDDVKWIIEAIRAARQEVPGRAGSYRFTEVKK